MVTFPVAGSKITPKTTLFVETPLKVNIYMRNFKGIHDTCDRLLLSHPAHVYGSTGAGSTPKDSLQYRILEEVAEHEVLRCTPATPETVGRGSPEWKPLLKKGGK